MSGISLLQYHIYDGHDRYPLSESLINEKGCTAKQMFRSLYTMHFENMWKKYGDERLTVTANGIVNLGLDCMNADDLVTRIRLPSFKILSSDKYEPLMLTDFYLYFRDSIVSRLTPMLRSYEMGNASVSLPILQLEFMNSTNSIWHFNDFSADFMRWINAECERIGI